MRQPRWRPWFVGALASAVLLVPGLARATTPSLPMVVYGTARYPSGSPVASGTVQGYLAGQASGVSASITAGSFGSVGLGGAPSVIVDGSTSNPDDTGQPVSLAVNGAAAHVSVVGCWDATGAPVSPTPSALTWQSGWVCEVSLTVSPPPAALRVVTSSLPGATVGVPYSASLSATGGTPPYNWSIASGALPPGLTLDEATGEISGVPTSAELAAFSVRVTDSSAPQAASTLLPLVLLVANPGVRVTGTATTTITNAPSTSQPAQLRVTQAGQTVTEVSVVGFTGTVNVADYASDPAPTASSTGVVFSSAPGAFFDVSVNGGSGLGVPTASLVISQCAGAAPGENLYWFDGGTWRPVSPKAALDSSGCLTATLTSDTSPTLSQLSGTAFAVGTVASQTSGGGVGGGTPIVSSGTPITSPPTVSSVSPNRGPATGGTSVTIRGAYFTGAMVVRFGSIPTTSFTVDSDTEITAIAPAGTGMVDITVTTPSGTSNLTPADTFQYNGNVATFSDVPSDFWAYPYIEALAAKGTIDGFPNGTFQPQRDVTRAQFVKMLVLTLGLGSSQAPAPFRDVPASAWYSPYVSAAATARIITGTSPGLFRPDAIVSREEAAVLLARALKLSRTVPLHVLDAALVDPWARSGVEEAMAAGLMQGLPNGTFQPRAATTRAQAAKVLDLALQIEATSAH